MKNMLCLGKLVSRPKTVLIILHVANVLAAVLTA